MEITVSRGLPDVGRAATTGHPHSGSLSHDKRSKTVTWVMDAKDAVELADGIDRLYAGDDMAHEDAAAIRHHALRALTR